MYPDDDEVAHDGVTPKPGLYKHYKGGTYCVLGVGQHSEDGDMLVVYYNIDNKKLWVRPLSEFLKPVELEEETVRFKFLTPASARVEIVIDID